MVKNDHPEIRKTNYTNFFRYLLFEPIMQISFTQLYKEADFSYEEFEVVTEEIKAIRDRYN